MILVFGSIYLHEKTFLKIKYIKSHYQSAIRDQPVQQTSITENTNLELQLDTVIRPLKRIPFFTLIDLYDQNIVLKYCYYF